MTKLASMFLAVVVVAGCSLGVDEVPFSEGEGDGGEGEATEGEGESATGEGEGEGEAPSVTLTLNAFAVVAEAISVSAANLTLAGGVDPTTCTFSVGEGAERRPLESGELTVVAGANVVHVECGLPPARVTSDFTVQGWALESFNLTSGGPFTVVTRGVDADTLQLECDLGATSIVVGAPVDVQLSATTNVVPSPTANVTVFPSAHLTVSCSSTADGATATEMSGPSFDVHVAPAKPDYVLAIENRALVWKITASGAGNCAVGDVLASADREAGAETISVVVAADHTNGVVPDVAVACTDGVGGPTSALSDAREQIQFGSLTLANANVLRNSNITVQLGDLDLAGEAGSGHAFPQLVAVAGALKIRDDTAASGGYGLDFSALRLVAGALTISENTGLTALTTTGFSTAPPSFPALVQVSGNFTLLNNANLTKAVMASLERVGPEPQDSPATPVSFLIEGNAGELACASRQALACNLLDVKPSVNIGTACACQ